MFLLFLSLTLSYLLPHPLRDVPDNGNSEVFINLDDNTHLDEAYGGYAVFAQIEAGDADSFATVDAIAMAIAENEGSVVPIQSVCVV